MREIKADEQKVKNSKNETKENDCDGGGARVERMKQREI